MFWLGLGVGVVLGLIIAALILIYYFKDFAVFR